MLKKGIMKKSGIGLSLGLILVAGAFLFVPNATSLTDQLKETNQTFDLADVQNSVTKHFYNTGELPSTDVVEVGKPAPINLMKLGDKGVSYHHSLWVDYSGEVYDLPEDFLPPKNVEPVLTKEGSFLRWESVSAADSYEILFISNKDLFTLKDLFGDTVAPMTNMIKGKTIVKQEKESFSKDGNTLMYPIELKEKGMYLIKAHSYTLGYTPAVGVGH